MMPLILLSSLIVPIIAALLFYNIAMSRVNRIQAENAVELEEGIASDPA
jgi:hypothetical protein